MKITQEQFDKISKNFTKFAEKLKKNNIAGFSITIALIKDKNKDKVIVNICRNMISDSNLSLLVSDITKDIPNIKLFAQILADKLMTKDSVKLLKYTMDIQKDKENLKPNTLSKKDALELIDLITIPKEKFPNIKSFNLTSIIYGDKILSNRDSNLDGNELLQELIKISEEPKKAYPIVVGIAMNV